MNINVGDTVTVISLYDPYENVNATFLKLGQQYKVKDFIKQHGMKYIVIYSQVSCFSTGLGGLGGYYRDVAYHPAHFDIKYARKEKLNKLNKISKDETSSEN